jgi:hypothetical protein
MRRRIAQTRKATEADAVDREAATTAPDAPDEVAADGGTAGASCWSSGGTADGDARCVDDVRPDVAPLTSWIVRRAGGGSPRCERAPVQHGSNLLRQSCSSTLHPKALVRRFATSLIGGSRLHAAMVLNSTDERAVQLGALPGEAAPPLAAVAAAVFGTADDGARQTLD